MADDGFNIYSNFNSGDNTSSLNIYPSQLNIQNSDNVNSKYSNTIYSGGGSETYCVDQSNGEVTQVLINSTFYYMDNNIIGSDIKNSMHCDSNGIEIKNTNNAEDYNVRFGLQNRVFFLNNIEGSQVSEFLSDTPGYISSYVSNGAENSQLSLTPTSIQIQSQEIYLNTGGQSAILKTDLLSTTRTFNFPNSDGTLALEKPYKVYTALLTQTSGAPTAIVLENTLGFVPTWQEDSTGSYFITESGAFDVDKTVIFMLRNSSNYELAAYAPDGDSVWVEITQIIGVSPFNVSAIDNVMVNVSIEIRVYN